MCSGDIILLKNFRHFTYSQSCVVFMFIRDPLTLKGGEGRGFFLGPTPVLEKILTAAVMADRYKQEERRSRPPFLRLKQNSSLLLTAECSCFSQRTVCVDRQAGRQTDRHQGDSGGGEGTRGTCCCMSGRTQVCGEQQHQRLRRPLFFRPNNSKYRTHTPTVNETPS